MHPLRHVWGRPLPRDRSASSATPTCEPQAGTVTGRPSTVTWLGFAPHHRSDDARSPGLSPPQCRSTMPKHWCGSPPLRGHKSRFSLSPGSSGLGSVFFLGAATSPDLSHDTSVMPASCSFRASYLAPEGLGTLHPENSERIGISSLNRFRL